MFTGIVQGRAKVQAIERHPGIAHLRLALPRGAEVGLQRGASVAVAGVCLTATDIDAHQVSFDVIEETLARTNLGELAVGDAVNVERSARAGDEIGGHPLSGHVDATAEIVALEIPENNHVVWLQAPAPVVRYVFPKGFIALDGASLTVVEVERRPDGGRFSVHLIPETLTVTTFGDKGVGRRVNVEVDRQTQAIVETVRAYLAEHSGELAT